MKIAIPLWRLKLIEASNQNRLQQLKDDLGKISPDLKAAGAGDKIGYLNEKTIEASHLIDETSQYYVGLPYPITAEKLHAEGFDDWLRIEKMEKRFDQSDREEYEAFVQGFLYYHEQYEIKNLVKDARSYTLYFDWGETSYGKYELIVYIYHLDRPYYTDYKRRESKMGGGVTSEHRVLMNPLPPPPSMTDPLQPPPPPPPVKGR